MKNGRTYIPYLLDNLVAAVDSDAAILACKLGTFADEKGVILVSFSFLANLWNWDERRVKKAAKKLSALDIWQYKQGDGRGHVTEWKKGSNFAPFVTLKGVQNDPIKGADFAPYNKEYNKDRLISAPTRVINQSNFEFNNAGDTPATPEVMDQFNILWQAFFFGSYAKYEKEQAAYRDRALAVWKYMPAEKRERLLRELRAGKRYDKTHWVLWYLQNYNPAPRMWFNGDDDLTPNIAARCVKLLYKGRCTYCMPEDKDELIKLGAKEYAKV